MNTIEFNGNIYIFYSFDIGDDIDLNAVKESPVILHRPLILSKYFKNYHIPLEIEIPHPHSNSRCISAKLHTFGVISLIYQIPFNETLEDLRNKINDIEAEYSEQSVIDAGAIFKNIKKSVKQPRFFHLRTSYTLIQTDPVSNPDIDTTKLKKDYGNLITSLLRFETESLSEYQKNEILDSAIGYYRGELIIVDTEATFMYATDYFDLLNIFEFANMQQLELQYYDRVLDQQLNEVYERDTVKKISFVSYLPFIGALKGNQVSDLGKLRVDISVITERLENSIKLTGETYYSELYCLLSNKLDIANWRESLNRKLDIVTEVRTVYENKVAALREDLLSILIIVLIFIEMIVAILHYFK